MSRNHHQSDRSPSPWFLTLREQKLVAAVALLAQAALVGTWLYSTSKGKLVDIDQTPHRGVNFRIDINAADASEFALLPDIGPTLAARIVAWREEHGGFKTIDDLRSVRGIGPKTWEKIRPYLASVDLAPLDEPPATGQRGDQGIK